MAQKHTFQKKQNHINKIKHARFNEILAYCGYIIVKEHLKSEHYGNI
jgi:hypothetical protein